MGKTKPKAARVSQYDHNDSLVKKPNKKAKKRAPRKLPPYMTLPEKNRFFKAIDNLRDRAIFRLLYHHGLRASEITMMQYSDYRPGLSVDLDRIYIRRLKGSISGEHAVVPAAAVAVRAWIRVRGIKPGVLFPSRHATPVSRQTVYRKMRIYCAAAQIPLEKAHPHTWKHSCCTHLISHEKESIMDVRGHVGHVNIRSTMIYADLMPEATDARAKRLKNWK